MAKRASSAAAWPLSKITICTPRATSNKGRCVAEHAATAAGSQRYQRHEGLAQRHSQPQHPRWLVVEGYNGANGWAIDDRQYTSAEEQDYQDAQRIYRLLEEEIVPLYYNQDRDGIPRGWVEVMREAIRSNAWRFSTRRMVKEYTRELYLNAMLGVKVGEPLDAAPANTKLAIRLYYPAERLPIQPGFALSL